MKGLLLNDFYTMKDQYKSYLKIIIPFIILMNFMSFTDEITELSNLSYVASLFMIVPLTMIITLFTYEEKSGFMQYALTMPLTRKNYIQGKYVFLLLNTLAGTLGGALAILISGLVRRLPLEGFDFLWLTAYSGVMALISLVAGTWAIALIIKFGLAKTRILIIGGGLLVGIFSAVTVYVTGELELNLLRILAGIAVLLVLATVFMFCMSFRWTEKKEL